MSYLITNFGLEGSTAEMPEGLRRQGLKPYSAYPREWYNYLLGHHDRAYKAHIRSRMHRFYDAGQGAAMPGFGSGLIRINDDHVHLVGQGVYGGGGDSDGVDLGFTPTVYYGTPGDPTTGLGGYAYVTDGTDASYTYNGGLTWTTAPSVNYRDVDYVSGWSTHRYIRRGVSPTSYGLYTNGHGTTALSVDAVFGNIAASSSTRHTVSDTNDFAILYNPGGGGAFPTNIVHVRQTSPTHLTSGYIAQFPSNADLTGIAVRYFKGYYWVSESFTGDQYRLRCYKQPKPWAAGFTQLHLLEPDYEYEWNSGATGTYNIKANENVLIWHRHTGAGGVWSNRCFFHPSDFEDVLTTFPLTCTARRLYYATQSPGTSNPVMMTELL